jgi:hypothetical protein
MAGPLAEALFWGGARLGGRRPPLLIVKRFAGWRRTRPAAAAKGPNRSGGSREAPARQLLGDADALAADGRYSEAAHLLLHRSIAEIDRRRPASIRKALTSRDIAALPTLPRSPADCVLARSSRRWSAACSAARPLDAGDWQGCRGRL